MKISITKHTPRLILLLTILTFSFISLLDLKADEPCSRYIFEENDKEPFFTGWCWTPEGQYLGETTECPSGSGVCKNWDCGASCDWIPIPNPD